MTQQVATPLKTIDTVLLGRNGYRKCDVCQAAFIVDGRGHNALIETSLKRA
jgi:hypothetical protein